MLNIILRDVPEVRDNLLPLTFTRSVADLRLGILTLRQKWELSLPAVYSYMTADYLSVKYPSISSPDDDSFIVSAHFFPTPGVVKGVERLRKGQALIFHDEEIARRCPLDREPHELIQLDEIPLRLTRPYDIFQLNAAALEYDFTLLTAGRESVAPSPSNTIIGDPSRLFIEPGATMEGAIVNLNHGPVYLAAGSEVMEGTCIRGGLALCEGAQIKMGSRIYGATTIGPHSKVGGEVANIVIIGYSNKAHDGFLGNAVIGEWCNIAAGCVASNLKNDYTEIKLWNYPTRRFQRTGLQFCGLIMGDHSKTGANTMINTATVFGVGVNFHGSGYPRNFVPSFTEGSTAAMTEVPFDKFIDTARRVMARRDVSLTQVDADIYRHLYDLTDTYR
ncbi:glucose-1-phosphate thymidylyltransferase [Muribaculaceae bacterium Isolate-004 (NCI)]|uniref:putative sugar nucleotidyl transferase n=1 Tax=Paramuribaculum intestinale TaxID=2094151 RepID=UPI000FFE771C|nr:putative sugar nucleotidyl transferase [Paramuribaculum intestinale]RXE62759.1 glucose-1-phosphate thymidylyltransferase [Muribaculaceae bacterium Isolate-004 (NCI)]